MTVKELIGILEKADEDAVVMLSTGADKHPGDASNIFIVQRYDELYGSIEDDGYKEQVILIAE